MKSISILFLSFFVMVGVTMAQEETPAKINTEDLEVKVQEPSEKPIMTFETKEVQFGEIEKGSDPVRTVSFTNTGNAPLIIKNAKGSCGCTVPTVPKEPVMPGETAEIKVRYDTNRVGPIRKTVRITTNEGSTPHILQVKGKVNAPAPKETLPVKEDGLTG